MKKIIILLMLPILLSGCSYVELNDLAIASAIGIDYKDDKFLLTAQIIDVTKGEGGGMQESSINYEASGKTIGKAIRDFAEKYPKNVYLGHIETFILGKGAVSQIEDIFDYFMRNPEPRTGGYVLINNKQTAKDTLQISNEKKGSFPAEEIRSSLESASKRSGAVNDISFEELVSFYKKKGIDPVVPLIYVNDEKQKDASNTIIKDMIVITKNGKLSKPLSEKQSIAYNTLMNKYTDVVINPKYENKVFGALLINPECKIDLKLEKNPVFTIKTNVEARISEIDKKINPIKKEEYNKISSAIEKELNSYIYSLLKYSKEENVDILGLGNMIYRNHYKEFDKYKNKNLYEIANIKVKTNIKMYSFGNINKGAA